MLSMRYAGIFALFGCKGCLEAVDHLLLFRFWSACRIVVDSCHDLGRACNTASAGWFVPG